MDSKDGPDESLCIFARISASYSLEVNAGEVPPPQFERRDRWPDGLYAFETTTQRVEGSTRETAAELFGKVLQDQVDQVTAHPAIAGLVAAQRGRLWMLITFGSETGQMPMTTSFLKAWGELGGTIMLDTQGVEPAAWAAER